MNFTGTGQTGAGVHNATKTKENFNIMAATIKINKVTYQSKSDAVRALLDQGKTIAEITRLVPNMGYAFAYGIAKRAGKAQTAANRRQTKMVVMGETTVTVNLEGGGSVTIDKITGKVTKRK